MTPLNLVRARIKTNALARWAGERGWTGKLPGPAAFDEGRALHHLVDEVFGPGALRPFRLLVPPRQASGNLYAYSILDLETLREAARIQAKPDHLGVLDPARMESKAMPGEWRVGQRLGFDLRVRPTRRLRHELVLDSGPIRQGAEVDAFQLEALRRHPDARDGMARSDRTREGVYLDWVAERLSSVAMLDRGASRLVRFQRSLVARGEGKSEGPDAVIHGTLTVTDGAAFANLLAKGVGRHRAYGYGMLLLSAPSRPAPAN